MTAPTRMQGSKTRALTEPAVREAMPEQAELLEQEAMPEQAKVLALAEVLALVEARVREARKVPLSAAPTRSNV